MKAHYHLVDVFTDRLFGGNQLAVFPDGRSVPEKFRQRVARELNLSETTFLLPPKNRKNNYRLRIFTPERELPMAGHPTVGTAFILAMLRKVRFAEGVGRIVFEEKVGPIPVTIERNKKAIGRVTMEQPLPAFGPDFPDRDTVANMLSLPTTEIDEQRPLQVVSCGLPFLFVPVKHLEPVQSIKFRLDIWDAAFKDSDYSNVFVFTREAVHKTSTVHSRMFAPGAGILEDPATGSASGPLGCYMVKYSMITPVINRARILSEQGLEIGRPSFIHVEIGTKHGQITSVKVGGECVYVGEGMIHLK